MTTVIATTTSRTGGRCQQCHCWISAGEPITKIDVGSRGGTTTGGNGFGVWICSDCAGDLDPAV